jgi:hypothetical protein
MFFIIYPKKQLYDDDRVLLILRMTGLKVLYEYMDRFMQEISQLVDDSIPKKVSLEALHQVLGLRQ